MATVLDQPKESIAGKTLTGKKASPKASKKESYVIYSIYYNDGPEGGYVAYSNHQSGWEFFGYLPAKQPTLITEPAHRRKDIQLL
ncbi:MAG: hypothetical protein JST50_10430 [Bacteroidetes bacterium]|jgi:hypothetical protein|nr:hypothetical protein [Bacteroidota bacterium]